MKHRLFVLALSAFVFTSACSESDEAANRQTTEPVDKAALIAENPPLVTAPVQADLPGQSVQSATVTLSIPGMTCAMCPITIRKALEKVDGVIEAKADYDSRTATVTYDPAKTTTKTLSEACTNIGYPASVQEEPS